MPAKFCRSLTDSAKEAMHRAAKRGEAPSKVWQDLNKCESELHARSQARYARAQAVASRCKKLDNSEESAVELLQEPREFQIVYLLNPVGVEPFALGLISKRAVEACKQVIIKELFLDPTHRANSSGLELFGIVGRFLGAGFPIACMLLQGVENAAGVFWRKRKERIREFLQAVRFAILDLRPTFFFSDKDKGQLWAMQAAHDMSPSICLWRILKSVSDKMRELMKQSKKSKGDKDKGGGSDTITDDHIAKIRELIIKHYDTHPFFSRPGMSRRSLCAQLIATKCGATAAIMS